jgi:hypothetical protein
VEKEATHHEQIGKRRQKSQSTRTRRSSSPSRKNYKAQREDARNIITQARVNRSRYEWMKDTMKTKKKKWGVLCFTRRVRRTQVPKGFKLPHDQQNMMGHKNLNYGYQIMFRQ